MLAQSVLDGYNVSTIFGVSVLCLMTGLHFCVRPDRFRKVMDDGRRPGELRSSGGLPHS